MASSSSVGSMRSWTMSLNDSCSPRRAQRRTAWRRRRRSSGSLHVVVVEEGLLVGVGGGQPELPRAELEVQHAEHTDALGVHALAAAVDALGGVGLHEDHQVVAQAGALGGPAEGHLDAGGEAVQRVVGPGAEGGVDHGMVAQVLAHAGEVVDQGDAHLVEVARWADAGQEQDVGGADGTGGEDESARPRR